MNRILHSKYEEPVKNTIISILGSHLFIIGIRFKRFLKEDEIFCLIKKEVGFQVSWIIFFPAINATSVFYIIYFQFCEKNTIRIICYRCLIWWVEYMYMHKIFMHYFFKIINMFFHVKIRFVGVKWYLYICILGKYLD